ncbi:hypothetical protein BHYA_0057g00330 [Botrytis hyacinthi]|uniref:Uncharacterized protein n=1 Tax=Botrytis hyacinthi TaxID=278943 RepID=A0A4Z1GR99_9HELO|nr:hypothetical protein BHYA_0057g00330 [Botrytis hyacinthi]
MLQNTQNQYQLQSIPIKNRDSYLQEANLHYSITSTVASTAFQRSTHRPSSINNQASLKSP